MPDYGYAMAFIQNFIMKSIDGLPAEIWWFPTCVLVVLMATAAIDAWSGIVPDLFILPGFLAVILLLGFYVSWPLAGQRFALGFGIYILVLLLNIMWTLLFKNNALGMGDAKWSMMAVAAYGILPVGIAWGIGAWLAIAWLIVTKLLRRPVAYVHFAPFLFVGLIMGLWWTRMR